MIELLVNIPMGAPFSQRRNVVQEEAELLAIPDAPSASTMASLSAWVAALVFGLLSVGRSATTNFPTTPVCATAFEGYPATATCPYGMTVVDVAFAVRADMPWEWSWPRQFTRPVSFLCSPSAPPMLTPRRPAHSSRMRLARPRRPCLSSRLRALGVIAAQCPLPSRLSVLFPVCPPSPTTLPSSSTARRMYRIHQERRPRRRQPSPSRGWTLMT